MSDYFGEHDPRKMPAYLFSGNVDINYDTAERADVSKQDYTVCPRHWYIDAAFTCRGCDNDFVFTADEQRFWYETMRFYVDSRPVKCNHCRKADRELKELRQEYDRDIAAAIQSNDTGPKRRLVEVIDALTDGGVHLPDRIRENRATLMLQIEKIRTA